MSGLKTLGDLARLLDAAHAADQIDRKLDLHPVTSAFFADGVLMTVVPRGDGIRLVATAEAGAQLIADLDHHKAAALGLGLAAATAAPQTTGSRE